MQSIGNNNDDDDASVVLQASIHALETHVKNSSGTPNWSSVYEALSTLLAVLPSAASVGSQTSSTLTKILSELILKGPPPGLSALISHGYDALLSPPLGFEANAPTLIRSLLSSAQLSSRKTPQAVRPAAWTSIARLLASAPDLCAATPMPAEVLPAALKFVRSTSTPLPLRIAATAATGAALRATPGLLSPSAALDTTKALLVAASAPEGDLRIAAVSAMPLVAAASLEPPPGAHPDAPVGDLPKKVLASLISSATKACVHFSTIVDAVGTTDGGIAITRAETALDATAELWLSKLAPSSAKPAPPDSGLIAYTLDVRRSAEADEEDEAAGLDLGPPSGPEIPPPPEDVVNPLLNVATATVAAARAHTAVSGSAYVPPPPSSPPSKERPPVSPSSGSGSSAAATDPASLAVEAAAGSSWTLEIVLAAVLASAPAAPKVATDIASCLVTKLPPKLVESRLPSIVATALNAVATGAAASGGSLLRSGAELILPEDAIRSLAGVLLAFVVSPDAPSALRAAAAREAALVISELGDGLGATSRTALVASQVLALSASSADSPEYASAYELSQAVALSGLSSGLPWALHKATSGPSPVLAAVCSALHSSPDGVARHLSEAATKAAWESTKSEDDCEASYGWTALAGLLKSKTLDGGEVVDAAIAVLAEKTSGSVKPRTVTACLRLVSSSAANMMSLSSRAPALVTALTTLVEVVAPGAGDGAADVPSAELRAALYELLETLPLPVDAPEGSSASVVTLMRAAVSDIDAGGDCVVPQASSFMASSVVAASEGLRAETAAALAAVSSHSPARGWEAVAGMLKALAGARVSIEEDSPLGATLRSALAGSLAGSDPHAVAFAAECLGRLCAATGDRFTGSLVRAIAGAFTKKGAESSLAGYAAALAAIHRHVGGTGSDGFLPTSVSVLTTLARSTVPETAAAAWMSLKIVADAAGLGFRRFLPTIMATLTSSAAEWAASSPIFLASLGRIGNAVAVALGPDLPSSQHAPALAALGQDLLTNGLAAPGSSGCAAICEGATLLASLAAFAGHGQASQAAVSPLASAAPSLAAALHAPKLAARRAAVAALRIACGTSPEAVVKAAPLKTVLLAALDAETSPSGVHDLDLLIERAVDAVLPDHPEIIVSTAVAVMAPSASARSNSGGGPTASSNVDDASAGMMGAGSSAVTEAIRTHWGRRGLIGAPGRIGVSDPSSELTPRWRTKRAVLSWLRQAVATAAADPDGPAALAFQPYAVDTAAVALRAATAGVAVLRPAGYLILTDLIAAYRRTPDPALPSSLLLETSEAQVGAVLRSAFTPIGSSGAVVSAGAATASEWVISNICKAPHALKRITSSMTAASGRASAPSTASDRAIGLAGISDQARHRVHLALLGALARIRVSAALSLSSTRVESSFVTFGKEQAQGVHEALTSSLPSLEAHWESVLKTYFVFLTAPDSVPASADVASLTPSMPTHLPGMLCALSRHSPAEDSRWKFVVAFCLYYIASSGASSSLATPDFLSALAAALSNPPDVARSELMLEVIDVLRAAVGEATEPRVWTATMEVVAAIAKTVQSEDSALARAVLTAVLGLYKAAVGSTPVEAGLVRSAVGVFAMIAPVVERGTRTRLMGPIASRLLQDVVAAPIVDTPELRAALSGCVGRLGRTPDGERSSGEIKALERGVLLAVATILTETPSTPAVELWKVLAALASDQPLPVDSQCVRAVARAWIAGMNVQEANAAAAAVWRGPAASTPFVAAVGALVGAGYAQEAVNARSATALGLLTVVSGTSEPGVAVVLSAMAGMASGSTTPELCGALHRVFTALGTTAPAAVRAEFAALSEGDRAAVQAAVRTGAQAAAEKAAAEAAAAAAAAPKAPTISLKMNFGAPSK